MVTPVVRWLTLNSELIGINTAILAPDGGNIGISFAIPSNMGEKPDLARWWNTASETRWNWVLWGLELNSELAKAMKVDAQRGCFRKAGSA